MAAAPKRYTLGQRRAINAHAKRRFKDWDESQHPRDPGGEDGGQWISGGGDGSSSSDSSSKVWPKEDDGSAKAGDTILVFRLGRSQGGLAGRNGGNVNAVASHLVNINSDDGPQQIGGSGNAINVYRVKLLKDTGKYVGSVGGSPTFNQPDNSDSVGRSVRRSSTDTNYVEIAYSFPASGDGFEHAPLASVSLDSVNAKLGEMGYRNSDDAGTINTAKAIRSVLPPAAGAITAGDLFAAHFDPAITADQIIAKVPGAAEKIAKAEHVIKVGVATNAPVADGGFIQPDKTYTSERQTLWEHILSKKYFTAAKIEASTPLPGVKPTMTVLGGRGGSGKSWFTSHHVADAKTAIYLNSDDVQEHLPGYNGLNAALYHDEASAIVAFADNIAKELGINVIHDATMRTPGGTAKRVDEYQAAGYRVEGHYMFLPPQMSTQRAMERLVRGEGFKGRYVPATYLLGSVTNEKTFDDLRSKFDRWSIYENMGAHPKLVAEGGK